VRSRQEFFTFCRLCPSRCSIKAIVEEGKLLQIDQDRESGLESALCIKGFSLPEILNHPDRLRYPQKRTGARGEGKWERISWEEALNIIAKKLQDLKEEFGPECVACGLGDPRGLELAFFHRFASAFGTPNVATQGHVCHMPGVLASNFTFGFPCTADEKTEPRLVVVWGSNFLHTRSGMQVDKFSNKLDRGTKLVVIDPRKIDPVSRAQLWIKPRPGSDGALAMGMMKVIIEEKLYDEDFITKWAFGFDQLQKQMKNIRFEDVERVTWVPQTKIKEAARLYGEIKPAVIQWGNALDQTINSFQTCRVISILRAITGNLDIPGGEVFMIPAPSTRPGHFMLLKEFPRNIDKALGNEFKLAMKSAFIPRQSMIKAILEEEPYPIKAGLFFGTNPLITATNTNEIYQALIKIDFLVVSDLFLTPTAALADIVLPAASGCEFDEIGPYPPMRGALFAYPKLVDPPGECWSDIKIINNLAKRVGLSKYFWDDEREALDFILKPSGLSFQEFKQKRVLKGKVGYRKYQNNGFKTPSGKVEIYSQQLEDLGYSPLPLYHELSRSAFGSPEPSEEYPLLLTNAKERDFIHSAQRSIASLRKKNPDPVIELNPDAAQRVGATEGDWVYIETRMGRIKQKLSLNSELDHRVAIVSYGWWFPEDGPENLYGWNKSSINILTESKPPYEPTLGSVELRGIPCRVYKA